MAETVTTTEAVNTHDQLRKAGGGVAIRPSYTAAGRQQHFYGWAIYRVGADGKQIATNPMAPWYDYGKKVFGASSETGDTSAERSREALYRAKEWVSDQGWYSGEWKRNRMRDYVPADINKWFPLRKG